MKVERNLSGGAEKKNKRGKEKTVKGMKEKCPCGSWRITGRF